MSKPKILTTGATHSPASNKSPRLEINEFIKDRKQFSLYVQALQSFFSETNDPRVSFYSIAGIHGEPYVDWNGSPSDGKGFCVHVTMLFLTWHRVYVALLEQKIHDHANAIADTYPIAERQEWKTAAGRLRQPFWDWARDSVPPDAVISDRKVVITSPEGEKLVHNPFYEYLFRKDENAIFKDPRFRNYPRTLRYPTSDGPGAESDVAALKKWVLGGYQTLENISNTLDLNRVLGEARFQKRLKKDVERLFSIKTWHQFSTVLETDGATTNSLEALHNKLHGMIARRDRSRHPNQSGNMSHPPYAGFDPIFYLHHSQIDRLVSLWHARTKVWVPDEIAREDLMPFWNTQETYWNSSDIEYAETSLNYSYKGTLKELYGDSFSNPISTLRSQMSVDSNSITEWTVRIRCKQFGLAGSFSTLLFLGDVPDSADDWFTAPTFVGSFYAFVNPNPEECANCRDHEDAWIQGFVHIDDAIAELYNLPAPFDPEVLIPILTKDLHWRVLKVDGTVPALPPMEVRVLTAELTLPPGVEFPDVGEPVFYDEITRGKPGGVPA